jgi:hypothetical protein
MAGTTGAATEMAPEPQENSKVNKMTAREMPSKTRLRARLDIATIRKGWNLYEKRMLKDE